MTHPSKVKGNRVEREIVKLAQSKGLEAKRAYASNGLSLGHSEETDVLIGNNMVQVKARKKFPEWLIAAMKNVDLVVLKENNKPPYVMLDLDRFLSMLSILKTGV